MRRLRTSEGACPYTIFNIVTGARNSTRAPAVARPVIKRIHSIWAASIIILLNERQKSERPVRSARGKEPLLAGAFRSRLRLGHSFCHLRLHGIEVEARAALHRRGIQGRLGVLSPPLLGANKTPRLGI